MMNTDEKERPGAIFELKAPFSDPVRQKLFSMMRKTLERVFVLDELSKAYEMAHAAAQGGDFLEASKVALGVDYEASPEDMARIPESGPLVVVANHPFGGVETLLLLAMLRRRRPDVKVMSNYLIGRIPEMHAHCIFVDPYGGGGAAKVNLKPIKDSIRWLKEGHVLIMFPSGDVSRLNLAKRQVEDPQWSGTVARIIRTTKATVLPIFVEGRNSALFQVAGMIHPRLRTALIPRENVSKRGKIVRFRLGSLIPVERLSRFEDDTEMADYLRLRTYILMGRADDANGKDRERGVWRRFTAKSSSEPVAPSLYPDSFLEDLLLLPPEQTLLETEDFTVYLAAADQIPHLLHEIGRQREITFRAVGEGSGKALDLDRFDQYYKHLFLWSRKNNELAGAYRLGPTDEILPRLGKKGLYTSTLFKYRTVLLINMGPALEMGRSFVRPSYQRGYAPLMLLWKGIARYMALNPRYRHLFGPVSINNEYKSMSRQLMEAFLRANNFKTDWARYVKPRNPSAKTRRRWDPQFFDRAIQAPEEMAALLAEIEKEQKGVPVLLKQYLKLGGKLLGFNVDPQFCDVLDGLIWVDLLETDVRILDRFMGKEEAQALRDYQRGLKPEDNPLLPLKKRLSQRLAVGSEPTPSTAHQN